MRPNFKLFTSHFFLLILWYSFWIKLLCSHFKTILYFSNKK